MIDYPPMSGWLDRRAQELGYKDYSDYLFSDYWKGLKSGLRDCEIKGCTVGDPELHHLSYWNLGSEQLGIDVVALCSIHHASFHAYGNALGQFPGLELWPEYRAFAEKDRVEYGLSRAGIPGKDGSHQPIPPRSLFGKEHSTDDPIPMEEEPPF